MDDGRWVPMNVRLQLIQLYFANQQSPSLTLLAFKTANKLNWVKIRSVKQLTLFGSWWRIFRKLIGCMTNHSQVGHLWVVIINSKAQEHYRMRILLVTAACSIADSWRNWLLALFGGSCVRLLACTLIIWPHTRREMKPTNHIVLASLCEF